MTPINPPPTGGAVTWRNELSENQRKDLLMVQRYVELGAYGMSGHNLFVTLHVVVQKLDNAASKLDQANVKIAQLEAALAACQNS